MYHTTYGDFRRFADAGLLPHLIPIIPPTARISPRSAVPAESLGKVPGRINANGEWAGYDWRQGDGATTLRDIEEWGRMGAGVGIRTGEIAALDIDVTDPLVVALILPAARAFLGDAPVRVGNAPRCILVYRTATPTTLNRLWLQAPGDESDPKLIEFLGSGQQFVACGTHPRTGQPYRWDRDPVYNELPVITEQQVADFFEWVQAELKPEGFTFRSEGGGGPAHDRSGINQEALKADLNLITAAVRATPNSNEAFPGRIDYIKYLCAIKAATADDPDLGWTLAVEWGTRWCGNAKSPRGNSEAIVRADYKRCHPPYSVGAEHIFGKARDAGWVDYAATLFEAEDPPPGPKVDWIDNTVYLSGLHKYYLLSTDEILTEAAYKRIHAKPHHPASQKDNAAMIFQQHERAKKCSNLTYVPRDGRFVEEQGQHKVNTWKSSGIIPAQHVTDADVQFWLDHLAYMYPDIESQNIILNWFAHLVRPTPRKANYALLMGSQAEGLGKDLFAVPIIAALGQHNVRTVTEDDLLGEWTYWAGETELVLVSEVKNIPASGLNRLKSFITAPPKTVKINRKGIPQYEVPNVACYLAFTNFKDALQLQAEDRRWCVVWSDVRPRSAAYYDDLAAFGATSADKILGWLLQRDLAGFEPYGRAPATPAKAAMHHASLQPFDQWIINSIRDQEPPFEADIVTVADIFDNLPNHIRSLRPSPSEKRLTTVMEKQGAIHIERLRLGKPLTPGGKDDRAALWVIRRQEMYRDLPSARLVEFFWRHRGKVDPFPTIEAAD
jgi:hypothetical protein